MIKDEQCFPGDSVVKNLPASAGDTGSIPNLVRSHMPQSDQVYAPQLLSLCAGAPELRLPKPECPRARAAQDKLPQ